MSNFIISTGTIDKKTYLPIIYIILNAFKKIFYNYIVLNHILTYVECLGYSTGQMLTFFVTAIIKYNNNNNNKNNRTVMKIDYKSYFILFLILTFYRI